MAANIFLQTFGKKSSLLRVFSITLFRYNKLKVFCTHGFVISGVDYTGRLSTRVERLKIKPRNGNSRKISTLKTFQ